METKVFLDTNILFDMIDISRANSKNVVNTGFNIITTALACA